MASTKQIEYLQSIVAQAAVKFGNADTSVRGGLMRDLLAVIADVRIADISTKDASDLIDRWQLDRWFRLLEHLLELVDDGKTPVHATVTAWTEANAEQIDSL